MIFIFYLLIFITFNLSDIRAAFNNHHTIDNNTPHHAFKYAELSLNKKQNIEIADLNTAFLETLSRNDNPRSYSLLCQDMEISKNILPHLNQADFKKRNEIRNIAKRIIYCELLINKENKEVFHINSQLDKLLSVCEKNKLEDSAAIVVKYSKKYYLFNVNKNKELCNLHEDIADNDVRDRLQYLINNKMALEQSIERSLKEQYSASFANYFSSSLTKKIWNIFTMSNATYFCLFITAINLIYNHQIFFRIIEKRYSKLF